MPFGNLKADGITNSNGDLLTFSTVVTEAPEDGTQYVRIDGVWQAVDVPPGTIVGASGDLPGTIETGQQWYDTDSGRLFVYNGTVWVDASPEELGHRYYG